MTDPTADQTPVSRVLDNPMSRRNALRLGGGAALAALAVGPLLAACGGSTASGGKVTVLSFASYVDNTIQGLWKKQHPDIDLEPVSAAADSEMFTKLKAGGSSAYDVVVCDGGWAPAFLREGLVEVIDMAKIGGGMDVAAPFREDLNLPWVTAPNMLSLYPCEWAGGSLTYNTTVPFQPPSPYSWMAMQSGQIPKGKIGFRNSPEETLAIAGLAIGVPSKDVFSMTGSTLQEAVKWLKSLKPFKIFESDPEAQDAVRKGDVWMTSAPTTAFAAKINAAAGSSVAASVIPTEGAVGFADGPILVKGARNRDNAVKFIEFFATNPDVREYVFEQYAAAPTMPNVVATLRKSSPENAQTLVDLKADQPQLISTIAQSRLPDNGPEWTSAWDQVIA